MKGERDYAPGYARLLARDLDMFEEGSSAHAVFVDSIAQIVEILDPAHRVLPALRPVHGDASNAQVAR